MIFEKINKLSLPAAILISSVILGMFYFTSQISRQNSVEKQRQIEIQAKAEKDKTIAQQEPKSPQSAVLPNIATIKSQFIKECEDKYEVIKNEALYPIDLIEIKRDLAQKVCAEGGTFDRMSSFDFCENKVSYVQTLDNFINYCVNWKINKLEN